MCVFIFTPTFSLPSFRFSATEPGLKNKFRSCIKGQLTQTFDFSLLSPCTVCTRTLTAVCKSWSYFGVSPMERILPNGQKTVAMWSDKKECSVTSCVVLSIFLGGGAGSPHSERSSGLQSSCLTFSTQKSHVSAVKGRRIDVQILSKSHFETNWMDWTDWRHKSGHFICPGENGLLTFNLQSVTSCLNSRKVMIWNGWNIIPGWTIPLTLPGQKKKSKG